MCSWCWAVTLWWVQFCISVESSEEGSFSATGPCGRPMLCVRHFAFPCACSVWETCLVILLLWCNNSKNSQSLCFPQNIRIPSCKESLCACVRFCVSIVIVGWLMALFIPKIVFKKGISLVIIRPHDGFVFRPVRVLEANGTWPFVQRGPVFSLNGHLPFLPSSQSWLFTQYCNTEDGLLGSFEGWEASTDAALGRLILGGKTDNTGSAVAPHGVCWPERPWSAV